MPDEKQYTERDLILARREAFINGGVYWSGEAMCRIDCGTEFVSLDEIRRAARETYPLPPQTRPRVVTDARGTLWRLIDGVLEFRMPLSGQWLSDVSAPAILDLLANPTEPVPDEEG